MDKNSVLAVILISLIMTVWLVWFTPEPPQQPPAATAETEQVEDTQAAAVEPEGGPLFDSQQRQSPPVSDDSLLAAASTGEARFVSVETDYYTAILSTKGATIVSFELKDYQQFDQTTPVQMIENGRGGAIGLEFTTPASHLVSTKDLFFDVDVAADSLTVGDGGRTVTFTAGIGDGQLEMRYSFQPGSYEIGLDVVKTRPERFMTREGYELVWTGGIPFAEGLGNQEAPVAAAIARSGGEIEQINLASDETERTTLNGDVEWVAVRNGFFTAVLIPDGPTRGAELEGIRVEDQLETVVANHYVTRLMTLDSGSGTESYRLYVGPIDFYEIRQYGLDLYDIVDYGFGQTITRPIAKWLIIPVFQFLSNFISNYGIIIILFAIFIKLLLFPLTKSSFKSMAMMRQLQPQMAEIKEKYGDDPQKQQQAMMKLYKESGVNPLGGCLPQLLQLPILYALFRFFPSAIEIRQEGFLWCNDLSAPDVLLEMPFALPIYGAHVSGFPLLMSAAMIIQMRLQGTHQQQAGQMKVMMMIMPVFILVIFNNFAAGLSLYYLTYNILSAIQQKFINKSIDEDSDDADGGESAKGKGGSKSPRASTPKNGQKKGSRKKSGSKAKN